MNHKPIQHLYWRAGFGISLPELLKLQDQSPKDLARQLIQQAQTYRPLLASPGSTDLPTSRRGLSKEEKKALKRQQKANIKELNIAWVHQMATTSAVLREKMTFFWHDHFACRSKRANFVLNQNNVLREHALGKFGNLLTAISKDPAMLAFLNNQQNRKAHPNENFAREVLELFSMGRGHYTEKDIQEAARAFTGWGFDKEGKFSFRKKQHDFGKKTFLGETGNWEGDDILRIILSQQQTARYLTEKLYRFLVGPTVDEGMVEQWAARFYQSDYDIADLVETILTSDHFYTEAAMGSRIKSPIELIVGLMRTLGVQFAADESLLYLQKLLGQRLFDPPNVAGWTEGRGWIDSSSIMARLKIPQAIILADYQLHMEPKSAFAGNEEFDTAVKTRMNRKLQAEINWGPTLKYVKGMTLPEIAERMGAYLLQAAPQYITPKTLQAHLQGESRETQVKSLVMRLLCTPEYQMC